MNTVQIDRRIPKIQNRLFEQAHSHALELKPIAIAMSKQGIQGEKLYSHPGMLPLPVPVCEYLHSFNRRQKAILSATFFANFYKYVANSEYHSLISNMSIAEKVFALYSDEFMILHQETNEEMDHIWSFRTVYHMVCRELGIQSSFDEPSFFYGTVGVIPQSDFEKFETRFTFDESFNGILSNLQKGKSFLQKIVEETQQRDKNFTYRVLRFLIGDAMRMLPAEKVQESGLGGFTLLYRYMANVELKKSEAYLFDSPEDFDYEPLAVELNQGHLTDEARHYTTSFELGVELYKVAPPEAQDFVRHFLQIIVEDYINASFTTYLEKLDLTAQGMLLTDTRIGLNSLRMSLHHKELADKQVDINQLVDSWRQLSPKWRNIIGYMEQKSWQYKSQQLERLIKELGLELNKTKLGNRYERYQDALAIKEIQKLVEVA
ncbi:MAG: hypothetical protein RMY62_018880 [Nostoc sp. ZfuVER08]|jgi:hypothetical protein|uniref:Uncharacterized protein n=1 Tax=Nostoc punctiforme FACHB-252 TaxID=1357509 RepID=A0ABR8HDA7_NOSPU|nr:hypothetical protein [Nostoc punctiforme]MBD2613448.1 hypothetical protein [Nostoc punctiforme FACHB-252]MBL1198712.1 hypothetical protein [Nostoc sp. GBBB01]MDZ8013961.1 hypothetical protein [Nostoc sp. ZfuVER08]